MNPYAHEIKEKKKAQGNPTLVNYRIERLLERVKKLEERLIRLEEINDTLVAILNNLEKENGSNSKSN